MKRLCAFFNKNVPRGTFSITQKKTKMETITLKEIIKQYLNNLGIIDVSDIMDTETNYKNLSIIIDIEEENISLKRIKQALNFVYGLTIFDPESNCTRGRIT